MLPESAIRDLVRSNLHVARTGPKPASGTLHKSKALRLCGTVQGIESCCGGHMLSWTLVVYIVLSCIETTVVSGLYLSAAMV